MQIPTRCPSCTKTFVIEVPDSEFEAWQGGVLIQNAMPSVPADVREQLVSGIDPKCWDEMFSEAE
jgi:hypothetical protein